jgi:hypothetical protein
MKRMNADGHGMSVNDRVGQQARGQHSDHNHNGRFRVWQTGCVSTEQHSRLSRITLHQ